MNRIVTTSVLAGLVLDLTGCAGGRVRGAQGTEMQQVREYAPESKVEPPTGNVLRTSGPLDLPNPPPVLEVDLERRRDPPPEPEPMPSPEGSPETKTR